MITLLLIFLLSALLTFGVKRAAPALGLVDLPNERSSHTHPTPRGGGIAFITVFFAALILFRDEIDPNLFWALCTALPVALIGFVDDIRPLSARLRLGVQTLCGAGALIALGGIERIDLGFFALSGIWLNLVALVAIVWLTNLYNFLDGLDGYAAMEGMFVATGGYLVFGHGALVWLAAAIGGFFLFNRPKASIFMGDVGSTTLGFIFGVWMFYDAATPHFIGWIVLLSLFGFDASITLLRRWRNGERLTQAHKKHMYQRLHQSGFSHAGVLGFGIGVNALFLGMLTLTPVPCYPYLLGFSIILLFWILRRIDSKKGFE